MILESSAQRVIVADETRLYLSRNFWGGLLAFGLGLWFAVSVPVGAAGTFFGGFFMLVGCVALFVARARRSVFDAPEASLTLVETSRFFRKRYRNIPFADIRELVCYHANNYKAGRYYPAVRLVDGQRELLMNEGLASSAPVDAALAAVKTLLDKPITQESDWSLLERIKKRA